MTRRIGCAAAALVLAPPTSEFMSCWQGLVQVLNRVRERALPYAGWAADEDLDVQRFGRVYVGRHTLPRGLCARSGLRSVRPPSASQIDAFNVTA